MDFTEHIKKSKPNASSGTIKTYNSLLKTIYINVFGNDKTPDLRNFSKSEEIINYLNDKPFNARKTYLSALLCIEPDEKLYKTLMLKDIKEYNDNVESGVKSEKLKQNEIDEDEIEEITNKLKNNAEVLFKKSSHKISDLMEIQNYIIFCLYNGLYIVPRRSLDYVNMKISNFSPETDNYMDIKKGRMVFNRFKTDKFKGQQVLEIPPALKKILIKWILLIPDDVDYLFFNKKKEKLTSITLNQRLNGIFGAKKSVNSFRHAYLEKKYKSTMEENKKMETEMDMMGSSSNMAMNYIKLN